MLQSQVLTVQLAYTVCHEKRTALFSTVTLSFIKQFLRFLYQ